MAVTLEYFLTAMIIAGFAYLYPVLIFLRDARKEYKHGMKENVINYILCIFILFFNYFVVFFIFITAFLNNDQGVADFLNLLLWPIYGLWIMIAVSTIIFHFLNKDTQDKLKKFEIRLKGMHKDKPLIEDFKRKFWHVMSYVFFWIGAYLLTSITLLSYPEWADIYAFRFWEYNSENPSELFFFIRFIQDPTILIENSVIHAAFMLAFMIAGYVTTLFEALRHSKYLYSPTNMFLAFFMREKEYDTLATYFQMSLSMSFAAFILPPLQTLAILGVICIADMMSSQFGIRWGKKKIWINPKKSWIGAVAGTVTALIVTTLTIGILYGMITAIIFLFIDVFTEQPIKISDNLSIPVVITIVYLIMNLLQVPYSYCMFLPTQI